MNILKSLRKPYFGTFLAALLLFISCDQGGLNTTNDTFDYSVYNQFIQEYSTINDSSISSRNGSTSTIDDAKKHLQKINDEYGTNIIFPDEFLGITDYDPQHIEKTALSKGWLTQNDIYLISEFESDLQKSDFDTALTNFEKNALNLGLSSRELAEKNLAANSLKALNHYHPEAFEVSANRDFWGCVGAVVGLVVASAALASCAAILPCGFAVTGWILAYASYLANCR